MQATRQTRRLYQRIILEGSYYQHQKDIAHLRKTIEEYGTLAASQPTNEDDLERDDRDNVPVDSASPMASVENSTGNNYCEAAQDLTNASSCNNQPLLSVGNTGELHEHHNDPFINDWSTWGQESLTGQHAGSTFLNFLDLSQRWNEL